MELKLNMANNETKATYDPRWQDKHRSMIKTPQQARKRGILYPFQPEFFKGQLYTSKQNRALHSEAARRIKSETVYGLG